MENVANKRLSLKEKFSFAVGAGSTWFIDFVFLGLAMWIYTDFFEIAPSKVGTMFLIAKIWDAINDPIMGMLVDRTKSKRGRVRPYLLFVPVPLVIFFILMCTVPDVSPQLRLAWAYITYIGLGMLYTALIIPIFSLIPILTNNLQDRLEMNQYRNVVTSILGIVFGGTSIKLLMLLGKGDMVKGIQMCAILFGIIVIICVWILYFNVKEPQVDDTERKTRVKKNIKEDLVTLIRNKPFLLLALGGITLYITSGMLNGSMMQYVIYVMGDAELFQVVMPITYIGMIAASFSSGFIVKRLGKRRTLFISCFMAASAYAIRFLTGDTELVVFLGMSAVGGFGIAMFTICFMPMISDTVEYGEWKTGKRIDGLATSAYTLTTKFGSAIGSALYGYLLEFTGYVPNVEQTQVALTGLRLANTAIVSIGFIILGIIIMIYPLSDEKVKEIIEEVKKNKADNYL